MKNKIVIIVLLLVASVCFADDIEVTGAVRLSAQSETFYVSPNDVSLFESYAFFDPAVNRRRHHLTITDKTLEMIKNSRKVILTSVFLFDTFYSNQRLTRDVVEEITSAIIEQKKRRPEMTVAIILDPVNKAYSNRTAPAVRRLVDNGAVVFYSDLVSTKSATRLGVGDFLRSAYQTADQVTLSIPTKILSLVTKIKIPIGTPLDEKGFTLEGLWYASALKANHRKLLVTDAGENYESLISSANPHNASVPSANFAVSVKGDIGKYIYMVLRADAVKSKKLNDVLWPKSSRKFRKHFFDKSLPAFDSKVIHTGKKTSETPIGVSFMTEKKIKNQIIEMLGQVKSDDEVRIQMFYLSEFKVVDAIIAAARKTKKPMRIILDPNKDAFNQKKDGTPNRQVAAWLMQKKKELNLNIEIRWYETHGEQNHAKIMSITNAAAGKYELFNGSANWTGKNLNDINMEANIRLTGAKEVTEQFNGLFDRFWQNADGMIYTSPYEGPYEKHAGFNKWRAGETWGYVAW